MAGESNGEGNNRELDRRFTEFLLRACHDLRAPLRGVRAHAELLLRRDRPPVEDVTEQLGFVLDGAKKIEALVDALASYSIALQIDPGSFQQAPMNVLLRSVLAKLDKDLRANGAAVTHTDLPRVPGNPDRLMEVLERLLRNSLQHRSDALPRIIVRAESQNDHWLFTIQDNGPGIEEAYLEKMFAPFERGHGGRNPGAGMGLAICRVIIERHNGRIWAESKPGEGATILFTLPAGS